MFNMTINQEIAKAAAILKAGGLVALPTETVYGLGGDARNPAAVAKIFAVKQRPNNHPLIVHLADASELEQWALETPETAHQLAQAFWPGPLTLILKKRPEVLNSVTGGQDTVALRVPRHPQTLAVLKAFGGGLVAPSANRFTRVSPTSAEAVRAELGHQVDMILDGGMCEVGVESTILDLSRGEPRILRPGMITAEAISAVIGQPVHSSHSTQDVRAPGMHLLHYAPDTRTVVLSAEEIQHYIQQLSAADLPAVCLCWSDAVHVQHQQVTIINMPDNAKDYAHELYATLRTQDSAPYQHIIIEAVPANSDWEAIRDRLQKASGGNNADKTRSK